VFLHLSFWVGSFTTICTYYGNVHSVFYLSNLLPDTKVITSDKSQHLIPITRNVYQVLCSLHQGNSVSSLRFYVIKKRRSLSLSKNNVNPEENNVNPWLSFPIPIFWWMNMSTMWDQNSTYREA
jgi:hypothetical protein